MRRERLVRRGYVAVLRPGHPRADYAGYVYEHLLIAERVLGRPIELPVQVHHVVGKSNARGLVICPDGSYHKLLHRRLRALLACGDPSKRFCPFCRQWDEPSRLIIIGGDRKAYHAACRRAHRHAR